jgi:hypothetical protein
MKKIIKEAQDFEFYYYLKYSAVLRGQRLAQEKRG